jgi:hypothetical protein
MRVFICSPYKETAERTIEDNIHLAKWMCKKAILEGKAPFAPHLIYPLILDDNDSLCRNIGLEAAKQFLRVCEEIWIPMNMLPSRGMEEEIAEARRCGIRIVEININKFQVICR